MGNTNVTPSEWDRKTNSWIPGSEVEARNARLKSKHLLTVPDSPNSHEENDNEEDNDDLFDADGLPTKRRKTNTGVPERVIEIKKWAPIDSALAEKLPEPKYLADRRPGMESLYGGAYKATNGFGTLGINPAAVSGAVGYDLGDGSGLGSASGVLGSTKPAPESTPVRRNMPPKRKKKKLGGPGRRKANPTPAGGTAPAVALEDVTMTDTPTGDNIQPATKDGQEDKHPAGDPEDSGSESEGEGSEEGEIEEAEKEPSQATAQTTNLLGDTDPTQTQTQASQTEVESRDESADITAQSDMTDTEMHHAISSEVLSSAQTLQAETVRQQAATPIAVPEETQPELQLEVTSTTETPVTETALPPPPAMAEIEANADANVSDNTAMTVEPEPELVLEQVPIPEHDPQATAVSVPTPEAVRTEDAVSPTFEQAEQTEAQDQTTQATTHTIADDTHLTDEAQPQQAPTPTQTSEPQEPQEPQQEAAEEQAQAGGEVDLLGGLEAAVEKEHRAI
ncbi:hypothetical protein A1O3_09698 [Capronia epimyces CBS 606.96]|uniref:Uncharacterized protein n=1 Tax=Capronia epimyces CBS 606.96 TaxID=1182542 RepID=W9XAG7_9EURO|nr:uncharacterized protein A1O3_09698 [Capronia epimyces CBS 606.96]EXJ77472.1 hypothetical protein A1O3_09698 [Capronia epimyces CBS 606.96]